MKLAYTLLIVAISQYSYCQSDDQNEVQAVLQTIFEGISEKDERKILSNCTADVKILENGVIWNADSTRNFIQKIRSVPFQRSNKLTFHEVFVQGGTAWCYYENEANIRRDGKIMNVKWLESAFLVKEGESWKVKMLHSTRL